MEEGGALVTLAASASEALNNLRASECDVLVSDIEMPDIDGYELIRRVRELNNIWSRDLPAVAVTAYARSEDRVRAISAGFQMHVSKPVEPRELIAVVGSLAKRHSAAKEAPQ
ncbi:MAG: response regulator [Pyrinomonadaceae bacterium]